MKMMAAFICNRNANNDSASGVFYSSGWPDGYQSSPSDCYYSILQKSAYDTIMILFMDIDLNSPDNVKIYGKEHPSSINIKLTYMDLIN